MSSAPGTIRSKPAAKGQHSRSARLAGSGTAAIGPAAELAVCP